MQGGHKMHPGRGRGKRKGKRRTGPAQPAAQSDDESIGAEQHTPAEAQAADGGQKAEAVSNELSIANARVAMGVGGLAPARQCVATQKALIEFIQDVRSQVMGAAQSIPNKCDTRSNTVALKRWYQRVDPSLDNQVGDLNLAISAAEVALHNIADARAAQIEAEREVRQRKTEVDEANGTVTKLKDELLQFQDAGTDLDRAEKKLDRAKADLRDAKADLRDAETKLDRAKADVDRAKADVDRAETKLDRAETKLDRAEADAMRRLEAEEKKLRHIYEVMGNFFGKIPTSRSRSLDSSQARGLTCEVCQSKNSISRAHILSSRVCNERNFFFLCGSKGAAGTCHDKFDHDLMGIMCVDPCEDADDRRTASTTSYVADKRRWFCFTSSGGLEELKSKPTSNPSKLLVNSRAELLLQTFSAEAVQGIIGKLNHALSGDQTARVISWLRSVEIPPLAKPGKPMIKGCIEHSPKTLQRK